MITIYKDVNQSYARLRSKNAEIQKCQAAGVRRLNLNDSGSARHSKLVVLFWNSLGMHVKGLCDAAFAAAVSLMINYYKRKNTWEPL